MKKNLFLIYLWMIQLSAWALIDAGKMSEDRVAEKNISCVITEDTLNPKMISDNKSGIFQFEVTPMTLNRDLSVITTLSGLPYALQLTMKQSFLTYEFDRNNQALEKGKSFKDGISWCDISRKYVYSNVSVEPYVQTSKKINGEASAMASGLRANVSCNAVNLEGKISYEEMLASTVVSSPAIIAGMKGTYTVEKIPYTPSVTVSFEHAGETLNEANYVSYDKVGGDIYNPDHTNVNIMNVSLACVPSKNMFMSLDYYRYLQNNLQVQTYSSNPHALSLPYTSGESRDLGEEINLKTVIAYTDSLRSEFFAGYFVPGEAYANQSEENKTFEIRGEIIVNF